MDGCEDRTEQVQYSVSCRPRSSVNQPVSHPSPCSRTASERQLNRLLPKSRVDRTNAPRGPFVSNHRVSLEIILDSKSFDPLQPCPVNHRRLGVKHRPWRFPNLFRVQRMRTCQPADTQPQFRWKRRLLQHQDVALPELLGEELVHVLEGDSPLWDTGVSNSLGEVCGVGMSRDAHYYRRSSVRRGTRGWHARGSEDLHRKPRVEGRALGDTVSCSASTHRCAI